MPVIKRTRTTMVIAVVLAAFAMSAAAWFGYWHIVDSRNPYGGHNSYGMRDYTPEHQAEVAKAIVAGLNSGNPDNVDVIRIYGNPNSDAVNAEIRQNITAVMPAPSCQYALTGIEDRGELDPAAAPWYHPRHAVGFDMKLEQICPRKQPTPRTIRVIAIPSGMGGYWSETALEERK